MKCQNCGKEEVNFHFTANINGNITEKHLCTECAEQLGYSEKAQYKAEPSFEEIFMDIFGAKPSRRMLSGYSLVFPTFIIPTMGMLVPDIWDKDYNSEAEETTAEKKPMVLDEEMQRRREINVLREKMKKAAETDDFEMAATLRDTIKKLEIGENS